MRDLLLSALLVCAASPNAFAEPSRGRSVLEPIAGVRMRCAGPVGKQIDANVQNWLLRAPASNPGLLAMFEIRDRKPTPNLVPWAGEFVGKYLISAIQALRLSENAELEATVRAVVTGSLRPFKRFHVDPSLPPSTVDQLTEFGEDADGVIVCAPLAGEAKPSYGRLIRSVGVEAAPGIEGKAGTAVQFDGRKAMLVYALKAFPGCEYTVSLWMACDRKEDRLGQVFSAWDHVMDDPLRICVVGGKLFARIEAGGGYSTQGVAVEPGRWYHLAVVKSGSQVTLYLDGKRTTSMTVPVEVHSSARDFALGGNPHYTGQSEQLACRLAKFSMVARALAADEISLAAQR